MPPHTQIPSTQPYPRPYDSTLPPSATALLMSNMKHDFLSPTDYLANPSAAASTTISPSPTSRFTPLPLILTSLLSTFCRAHSPILHTREGQSSLSTISTQELHRSKISGAQIGTQGPTGRFIRRKKGLDIVPELAPLPDEVIIIDEPGRGAFTNTELDAVLRAKGVMDLAVCGVTADAFVSSTVREASDRGYDVLGVEDGVKSMNEELKRWSLESIKVEGLFGVTADSKAVLEAVENWVSARAYEEQSQVENSVRLAMLL